MKQEFVFNLLKKVKADPKLMRKLKVALVVGMVGIVLTGTLLIWAGISAFKYVAGIAVETAQAPTTQAQIADLTTELQNLPTVQVLSCWASAQRLMDPQPWLVHPLAENLNGLKVACLGAEKIEQTETETERETI